MAEPVRQLMTGAWLFIGGDSEIGAAARRRLTAAGHRIVATTRRRAQASAERPFLDLSQPLSDWEPPMGTSAACIFAAVARLAACHADPERTAHVNVTQTIELVECLIECGLHVVYLSTNQVFDGRAPLVPPDAAMRPVSEYGRQKARTESWLHEQMAKGASIAILRLAKVVAPGMPLISGWAHALLENKPIEAFRDMKAAPTPLGDVVAAVRAMLQSRSRGIFQLTGARDVSYLEIAGYLAERLGADRALVTAGSASSAGLPPGACPANTTLDSTRMAREFGIAAADPWEVIDGMLAGIHSG